jgi:hypothetical protein
MFALRDQHRGHGLEVSQVLHVVPHAKVVLHQVQAGLGKKSGQKQNRKCERNDFVISLKLLLRVVNFINIFNELLHNSSPKVLKI